MDIDEWEYLPDDGFLDFNDTEKKVFFSNSYFDSKSVFNMYQDYCMIQSPNSQRAITDQIPVSAVGDSRHVNQLVPVQIQLNPPSFFRSTPGNDEELLLKHVAQEESPVNIGGGADLLDPVPSQVYFKQTWDSESVDMKLDSPKSPTTRGFAKFQFDDLKGDQAMESKVNFSSPRMKTNLESADIKDEDADQEGEKQEKVDHSFWKFGFTGIGAICSFGFAAATVCILFLGSNQSNNNQYQQNHKRFQIYTTDNKRIKEVANQATKFNEAFSSAVTRAHITSGGYYRAL